MKKLIYIFIALIFASCATRKYTVIQKNGETIIKGEFPVELLKNFNWFKSTYRSYSVDDLEGLNVIKRYKDKFDVVVFLGTWCGDSRRYVPRFVKIMEKAGVSKKHVKFIGLDRDKKLPGLTDKYQIKRVPTFIFVVNGTEIGRITEEPRFTLIRDIAYILARNLK